MKRYSCCRLHTCGIGTLPVGHLKSGLPKGPLPERMANYCSLAFAQWRGWRASGGGRGQRNRGLKQSLPDTAWGACEGGQRLKLHHKSWFWKETCRDPLPFTHETPPTLPSHIHPTRLFVSPHIGTSWMDQVYFILLFHVLQTPPKPHLLPLAVPPGCTSLLHNHKSADGPDLQRGMEDAFSFDKNMTLKELMIDLETGVNEWSL